MASESIVDVSQRQDDSSAKSNLEFQAIFETRPEETTKPKKKPRRILHFSDGTLEEYSTDEEEEVEKKIVAETTTELTAVDSSTMTWGPWFWYQTIVVGTKTLEVCDYLGETLAGFFGITSPKYQFEIDHYNNMIEEEKERQKEEDLEMGGWTNLKDSGNVVEKISAN